MRAIIISEVTLDALIKETINGMAESWEDTDKDNEAGREDQQSIFRGSPKRAAVYHLQGFKRKLIEA